MIRYKKQPEDSNKMEKRVSGLIMLVFIAAIVIVGGVIYYAFFIPSPEWPIERTEENVKVETRYFANQDELVNFVKERSSGSYDYYGYGAGMAKEMAGAVPAADNSVQERFSESAGSYSTTNIQVEGVDEPDLVKNDGKYVYKVQGSQVLIIEAYPADSMKIVSTVNLSQNVQGIFIKDGRLVVLTNGYRQFDSGVKCIEPVYNEGARVVDSSISLYPYRCGPQYRSFTNVFIYDIEEAEEPGLDTNVSIEGDYRDARMIGDYVYLVSSKYIQVYRNYGVELPEYSINGVASQIAADKIGYFDIYDQGYSFTLVSALNVGDGGFDTQAYLTGSTGQIFMSQDTLYLTNTKMLSPSDSLDRFLNDVARPLLKDKKDAEIDEIMAKEVPSWHKQQLLELLIQEYSFSLTGEDRADFDSEYLDALEEYREKIDKETQKTAIHKIRVREDKISYRASGEVNGHLLNQFSMDEYNGYFRIATTSGNNWGGGTSANNVYILDRNLNLTGSVEDLAEGERIYSVRFMGERAYVVTFKNVDPLFVIDVSDPEAPEVLGYLKVTGYSDYLHPLDETHLMGIGKEVNESIDADKVHSSNSVYYTAVGGLKISIFDVSDFENPKETAKIEIGRRGTSSNALYDHKAVLYDSERKILVLPVDLYDVNESAEVRPGFTQDPQEIWQGAYVFNVDVDEIVVKGRVTHRDNESMKNCYNYTDYPSGQLKEQCYWDYSTNVQRSLWMDEVLYTISESSIKANDIESLDELNRVALPYAQERYYGWGEDFVTMAGGAAVPAGAMVK